MGYIKHSDGTGTVAFSSLIMWHWKPEDHLINKFKNLPFEAAVVFVVSGALITRIYFQNSPQIIVLLYWILLLVCWLYRQYLEDPVLLLKNNIKYHLFAANKT